MTPSLSRSADSKANRLSAIRSSAAGVTAEAAAARVVSETAHDLRSPLTSILETVRLIHDGDLGPVNDDQQSCLAAVIDQCNCMDQMIGEMVQVERLRTGSPRANRSWTGIASIHAAVDEALRSWAGPRNVDVLWDIGDEAGKAVFADPLMLRRLIVNLATNAIRASREGGIVLIRLQRAESDEMIRWSVVDQGSGIAERDIHRIADRQVSLGGGEGIGLSICRQLAAVHFSTLQIRSRFGYGTEVSFQTPAMGPRSVAGAWSRWRVAARGPLQKPARTSRAGVGKHAAVRDNTVRQIDADTRVRLDPPAVTIELAHESGKPRCEDRFAAGIVTLGAAVSRQAADDFDRMLQSQLQMFELAYRTDVRRWVWLFDVDSHGVQNRITSLAEDASQAIDGLRMQWSTPQMIPVDDRRTVSRLSDLMVRESLAASTSSTAIDQDEVRLGSAPIVHSESAAIRLDAELRRLSDQMKGQSTRLRQQARNLRPQA